MSLDGGFKLLGLSRIECLSPNVDLRECQYTILHINK